MTNGSASEPGRGAGQVVRHLIERAIERVRHDPTVHQAGAGSGWEGRRSELLPSREADPGPPEAGFVEGWGRRHLEPAAVEDADAQARPPGSGGAA